MNPWKRIIQAASEGRGIMLSFEEVWKLSQDEAIQRMAEEEDEPVEPICDQPVVKAIDIMEALKASLAALKERKGE